MFLTGSNNHITNVHDTFVFHLQKSGLSTAIGEALTSFANFQPLILVLLVCIITAAITEVSSNTATATLFIPILAELVQSLFIFYYCNICERLHS